MQEALAKQFYELKKYNERQFEQIMELQATIKILKEENAQLKNLLETMAPVAQTQAKDLLTDEEVIAEREIKKLKTLSEQQSLTYEETKKLVEYVKILQNVRNQKKQSPIDETVSTEDLVKLLKS